MKLSFDDMCFACGRGNPIGMKLEFRFEGEDYVTTMQVKPEYQGWAGIAHGGLIATALDETMARLLWEKDISAITGRLEVRYRKPVPVGTSIEVRARITQRKASVIETEAQALSPDGVVMAEAKAVSVRV